MNLPKLDQVYEAALHALVTQRCQRAYAHDMRNGLQGIHGGFELLQRTLKSAATQISTDRTIDFSKQAIKNHERALDRILDQLVLCEEAAVRTEVGELLREVNRFLNNDASSRDIALRVTATEDASILVQPGRLRLVFVALIVDAIDSLPPHSELRVELSKRQQYVRIEFASSNAADGKWNSSLSDTAKVDLQAEPLRNGLIIPVTKKLVEAEGGSLHFSADRITVQFAAATNEN